MWIPIYSSTRNLGYMTAIRADLLLKLYFRRKGVCVCVPSCVCISRFIWQCQYAWYFPFIICGSYPHRALGCGLAGSRAHSHCRTRARPPPYYQSAAFDARVKYMKTKSTSLSALLVNMLQKQLWQCDIFDGRCITPRRTHALSLKHRNSLPRLSVGMQTELSSQTVLQITPIGDK